MKWYCAKIITECRTVGAVAALVDEQVFVLQATNAEDAFARANEIGQKTNSEYLNHEGIRVSWLFRGLSGLEEIMADSIESGTEITSQLHHNTEPASLIVEKERLSVFWVERVMDVTAEELLPHTFRPYAPCKAHNPTSAAP